MIFNRHIANSEILPLPHSNSYFITKNGDVYNDNIKVKKEINNTVLIDWVFGINYYNVSLLLAHTFKPLWLDKKWWDKLTVEFKDNDFNNLDLKNLVWKFPIKLGYEENNGFSFIPMFSRYMIDIHGNVFDTKLKRFVKGSYNQGYHSFRLLPDGGKLGFASIKRHRALGLSYLGYPSNVDDLQINHKDGITENDNIENLEWMTCSENILHAFSLGLRKPGPTPIKVRNSKTKEIFYFNSLVECSKYFGYTPTYIGQRLRDKENRIHKDYLQFKRKDDTTEWFNCNNVDKNVFDYSWERKILVKCLNTGEIKEFPNARKTSEFLKYSESTLSKYLKRSKFDYLYKNGDNFYIIKYKDLNIDWVEIKDITSSYQSQHSNFKPVLIVSSTGEIKEFPNSATCSKFLNILPTTLNYRLSLKGKKTFSEGYRFYYKEDFV